MAQSLCRSSSEAKLIPEPRGFGCDWKSTTLVLEFSVYLLHVVIIVPGCLVWPKKTVEFGPPAKINQKSHTLVRGW